MQKNRYYVWVLVLFGLTLIVLVLVMIIQDKYDVGPTPSTLTGEELKERRQERIEQKEAPSVEVDLMEEGVDFDADELETEDSADELNGFEDIDFEEASEEDIKI